jgi:hypothetical protein
MSQIQTQCKSINKDECPLCHFVFVSNATVPGARQCPGCRRRFMTGQRIDHGKSCSTCNFRYRGGNNVYYKDGCPALMSDGRFITYYNSSNELTEAMRKMNGFRSANQFRTFMQVNGDLFMASERNWLMRENTCAPTTACSEGWYDLWTKKDGYWANDYASPYSLNH